MNPSFAAATMAMTSMRATDGTGQERGACLGSLAILYLLFSHIPNLYVPCQSYHDALSCQEPAANLTVGCSYRTTRTISCHYSHWTLQEEFPKQACYCRLTVVQLCIAPSGVSWSAARIAPLPPPPQSSPSLRRYTY